MATPVRPPEFRPSTDRATPIPLGIAMSMPEARPVALPLEVISPDGQFWTAGVPMATTMTPINIPTRMQRTKDMHSLTRPSLTREGFLRVNPSVAPRQGPIKGESSICFDENRGRKEDMS